MYEPIHLHLEKLRGVILGILVLVVALLISLLLLPTPKTTASVASDALPVDNVKVYDNPNVIANGMTMAADKFTATMVSAGKAADSGRQSAAITISRGGKSMAHGLHTSASFVGHGVSGSTKFTVHTVGSTAAFVVHAPGAIINFATDTASVSSVIRPAEDMPVPKIDPVVPAAAAAPAPLPAPAVPPAAAPASQPTPPADSAAAWPIHGRITTLFGVPHWPYQPTHTGLDISDGQRSGVTPIKPFKPGRVIDTVRSSSGLGNHVVVDHGAGLTSVYGHLASISVQAGQAVDKSSTLGFEGSTGASTGTHLHLEIRVNGQAMDPRRFIDGQP